jgi:hypothetical protein
LKSNGIDVILVALGMIIGFVVILMHLTDMWPCSMINAVNGSLNGSFLANNPLVNSTTSFMDGTHHLLTNLFQCR